jgi:hypothetical protein
MFVESDEWVEVVERLPKPRSLGLDDLPVHSGLKRSPGENLEVVGQSV